MPIGGRSRQPAGALGVIDVDGTDHPLMFALAPVEPAPGRADAKQERTWGPVGSPLQPRGKTSEPSVALLDAFALLLAAVIIASFQRFRA